MSPNENESLFSPLSGSTPQEYLWRSEIANAEHIGRDDGTPAKQREGTVCHERDP